jgi:hypothetical protein
VSEGDRPEPRNVTVDSSVEFDGSRVSVAVDEVTVNMSCAKSPTLGWQPLLPAQPVISITYSPGETPAIMKLPLTIPVPTVVTQADEPVRIGLGLLMLLIEQD